MVNSMYHPLLLLATAASTVQSFTLPAVQILDSKKCRSPSTTLCMGDHSSATRFQVGDSVVVVEDVMKMGRNLKGFAGTVVETWEKCDVDPTCCCAEWVDEGLSVHVKFDVPKDGSNTIDPLLANDIFVHYFAESELEDCNDQKGNSQKLDPTTPFDGLSCKTFKLEQLKMGQQAQRIAAFEEQNRQPT